MSLRLAPTVRTPALLAVALLGVLLGVLLGPRPSHAQPRRADSTRARVPADSAPAVPLPPPEVGGGHPSYGVVFTPSSTLGYGVNLYGRMFPHVALRVGAYPVLPLSLRGTVGGRTLRIRTRGITGTASLELHPDAGRFRMFGGVLASSAHYAGSTTVPSTDTVTLDGTDYAGSDVRDLRLGLAFPRLVPYAGIGWGRPSGKRRRSTFLDVGAAFGKFHVSLDAEGARTNAGVARAIGAEQAELRRKMKRVLPVVPALSAGVMFAM